MNDFQKMDIFFVVATIAVFCVAALLIVVLVRTLRIVRRMDSASKVAAQELQRIARDMADARISLRDKSSVAGQALRFVGFLVKRYVGRNFTR